MVPFKAFSGPSACLEFSGIRRFDRHQTANTSRSLQDGLLLGFAPNRIEHGTESGKTSQVSFGLVALTTCGQVTKYCAETL
jgi:hypothetical protein